VRDALIEHAPRSRRCAQAGPGKLRHPGGVNGSR
jgi:hypothetical protein